MTEKLNYGESSNYHHPFMTVQFDRMIVFMHLMIAIQNFQNTD